MKRRSGSTATTRAGSHPPPVTHSFPYGDRTSRLPGAMEQGSPGSVHGSGPPSISASVPHLPRPALQQRQHPALGPLDDAGCRPVLSRQRRLAVHLPSPIGLPLANVTSSSTKRLPRVPRNHPAVGSRSGSSLVASDQTPPINAWNSSQAPPRDSHVTRLGLFRSHVTCQGSSSVFLPNRKALSDQASSHRCGRSARGSIDDGLRRWSHGARPHSKPGSVAERLDSGPDRSCGRDRHCQRGRTFQRPRWRRADLHGNEFQSADRHSCGVRQRGHRSGDRSWRGDRHGNGKGPWRTVGTGDVYRHGAQWGTGRHGHRSRANRLRRRHHRR